MSLESAAVRAKAVEIAKAHECRQEKLITILQDMQTEFNYLPREVLEVTAEMLDISLAKVYGVATFYENFSLEPKGKYIIRVCDGTACHVRKSIPILELLRTELGIAEGQHTTEDMMFTLETVSCLGACGLAPVLTLNGVVHPAMDPDKAKLMIDEIRETEGMTNEQA